MQEPEHWIAAGPASGPAGAVTPAARCIQLLLQVLLHAGAAENTSMLTCFSRYFPNFMVAIRCDQNCCCCCGGTDLLVSAVAQGSHQKSCLSTKRILTFGNEASWLYCRHSAAFDRCKWYGHCCTESIDGKTARGDAAIHCRTATTFTPMSQVLSQQQVCKMLSLQRKIPCHRDFWTALDAFDTLGCKNILSSHRHT